MATPRWAPRALNVAQTDSITVANTWATGDYTEITINSRVIRVTLGATQTAAAMASGISEAINGETATTGCTFSETGDNIPEFADLEATLNSSTVVYVTGPEGVPFTMTVTESTAGDGTSTRALVTAATGLNHWDDANNWDTGVLPADGDTVYIDNSSVDILYGLDQSAIEPAALHIAQSFTGTIGLPEINEDGGYHEYRSTYLTIGAVVLQIGAGAGNGSGRIRINSGSDPCALTVFNSGSRLDDVPAVLWKGTDSTNTLVQVGGDVGVAVYGAETATLATVTKEDGDLLTGAGATLSGALVQNGGTWTVNSLIDGSLTMIGGSVEINGTANVDQLTVRGGVCTYNTTGTLGGATVVSNDGVLDFGSNPSAVSVTNPIDLHGTECRFLDPNKRCGSVVVDLNESARLDQVDIGRHIRITRGTPA